MSSHTFQQPSYQQQRTRDQDTFNRPHSIQNYHTPAVESLKPNIVIKRFPVYSNLDKFHIMTQVGEGTYGYFLYIQHLYPEKYSKPKNLPRGILLHLKKLY